jgi:hypothetical protein
MGPSLKSRIPTAANYSSSRTDVARSPLANENIIVGEGVHWIGLLAISDRSRILRHARLKVEEILAQGKLLIVWRLSGPKAS